MRTREPNATTLLTRFFDRLVRRSFGDLALAGEPVAAYVAALLARFARSEELHRVPDAAGRPIDSVVGLLLEAQRAWAFDAPDFDPFRERTVRQHIGDYALFMTGLFREHVERRASTGYYCREGRRAYQAVADFERSAHRPEARLFAALAQGFEAYASALTHMRQVYLGPADLPPAARPLLRLRPEW